MPFPSARTRPPIRSHLVYKTKSGAFGSGNMIWNGDHLYGQN